MSKTITSPVEAFPGTVEIFEPLNWPQAMAWKKAVASANEHRGDFNEFLFAILPGVLACVRAFHLAGVPEHASLETFPASPDQPAMQLLAWLVGQVGAVVRGEDVSSVPFGSTPTRTEPAAEPEQATS